MQGQDIGDRLLDVSPLYLRVITGIIKYGSTDLLTIKFLQALVGVGNCLLIYTIGKNVFNRQIALLGALMYATYGNVIIFETMLEPEILVLFFNLLALSGLIHISQENCSASKTYLYGVIAGGFTGLSIITKPNFLFFVPIVIFWLLFIVHQQYPLRRRMIGMLLFGVTTALIILPVTLRNYLTFHDFVLVTADYGKVFFHGNAKGATGFVPAPLRLINEEIDLTASDEPDYEHKYFRIIASKMAGRRLRPSEAARFWFTFTLREIFTRPGAYLLWLFREVCGKLQGLSLQRIEKPDIEPIFIILCKLNPCSSTNFPEEPLLLELKKLHLFFHNYEAHEIAPAFMEYQLMLSYPFLRYGIISTLGLVGMFLGRKQFRRLFLLYGVIGIYLFSGMVFFVSARYRTPAVPYLCLFAGYAIAHLTELFKKSDLGCWGERLS